VRAVTYSTLGYTLCLMGAALAVSAGALSHRHTVVAVIVVAVAFALILAGGWFYILDARAQDRDASAKSARGPWRTRVFERAARLRDSDAPVSHARAIERGGR
jgi:hypothetical protein